MGGRVVVVVVVVAVVVAGWVERRAGRPRSTVSGGAGAASPLAVDGARHVLKGLLLKGEELEVEALRGKGRAKHGNCDL